LNSRALDNMVVIRLRRFTAKYNGDLPKMTAKYNGDLPRK
jgi:hypothetical protein